MSDYYIVSIAAYDRSGTTFLGGLLSQYQNAFYVGELDQGLKILSDKRETLCTCGSQVNDCLIWEKVPRFSDQVTPGEKTREIYRYLTRETGSSILIDSSKEISQVQCKTAHNEDNQVLVHLIRNPKGVIFSRMKTTKRLLSKGIHPRPEIARWTNLLMIMDAFKWCSRNVQLERYKKKHKNVTVIYEDLESAYESRILPFLREKVNLDSKKEENRVSHVLGGNINRYQEIGDIKIDYSWREGLTYLQKATVDFITYPVRKYYGYKF